MIGPFPTAAEAHRGYHSGLSGKMIYPDMQPMLATDGSPRRVIHFETGKYRPPFQVTLRTERTGCKLITSENSKLRRIAGNSFWTDTSLMERGSTNSCSMESFGCAVTTLN